MSIKSIIFCSSFLLEEIILQKKVIVLNRLEKPVLKQLQAHFDVEVFHPLEDVNHPHFIAALEEAHAIIGLGFQMEDSILSKAPNLEIVSTVSVGYNHLSVDLLTEYNIMATNTPGVLDETVADVIFGILIASARRIPELDHYVKAGKWTKMLTEEQYGVDVHKQKIGIIGMGRIGEAIAKRAHFGFDMDVLYYNRSRKQAAEEEYKAKYCTLEELLAESDFVVLMTPLTAETEGLIGMNEFKQMKDSAIFINGSRGKTIIEKDLIQALEEKEIAAAGLDVYEQEPVDPNNPLLHMDNVVTLPHVGSSTFATELAMSQLAADNVIAALQGEKPPTLLNESVWDKKQMKYKK